MKQNLGTLDRIARLTIGMGLIDLAGWTSISGFVVPESS